MGRINQELIERLKTKLGVGQAAVYTRIGKTGRHHGVARRDIAALLLAWEHNISVQKYANAEQMDRLDRATRGGHTLAAATPPPTAARITTRKTKSVPKTKENTVFVVHGRDAKLRDAMYELLGSLGLKAREWGHALRAVRGRGGNPFVSDAVTKIMETAQAIVVIFSPDDFVSLKPQFWTGDDGADERKPQGQARPNVLFETGLAIGTHHRKTLMVQCGRTKPFTDIGGMHMLRLSGSAASRNEFVARLEALGCRIDSDGDHWLRAGDFLPTEQTAKRKKASRKKRA